MVTEEKACKQSNAVYDCCKLKHSLPQNVLFTLVCKYENVSKAELLIR